MGISLNREEILKYASGYDEARKGSVNEAVDYELVDWFLTHKYLDQDHFMKLCLWKSPRPKKSYEDPVNSDERIKMITTLALKSEDEYFKVTVLQLLIGVSWPVASVILNFAQPDRYSILDFRALWSLGLQQPKKYDFDFWMDYTRRVNEIKKNLGIDLRTLDKALWFYSKENQKS